MPLLDSVIQTIESYLKLRDEICLVIDCGNGKDYGQIITNIIGDEQYKSFSDMYPDLEEQEDIPSCSVKESLDKQDLFVNDILAKVCANQIWNMLYHEQMPKNVTYVNLKEI